MSNMLLNARGYDEFDIFHKAEIECGTLCYFHISHSRQLFMLMPEGEKCLQGNSIFHFSFEKHKLKFY